MANDQRTQARDTRRHLGLPGVAAMALTLGLVVLGGCVGNGAGSCSSSAAAGDLCAGGSIAEPPVGAPIDGSDPSAAPSPGVTPASPSPADTVPPLPEGAAGTLPVVTVEANGTTLHLKVGDRFRLDLGSGLDWAVTVADERVVEQMPGSSLGPGDQGIYVARGRGTTLLTAAGRPHCTSGPCPLFRVGFGLTIVVS